MLLIITDVVDSDVWDFVLQVFKMHVLNLFFNVTLFDNLYNLNVIMLNTVSQLSVSCGLIPK